jgi:hypothetical protein
MSGLLMMEADEKQQEEEQQQHDDEETDAAAAAGGLEVAGRPQRKGKAKAGRGHDTGTAAEG